MSVLQPVTISTEDIGHDEDRDDVIREFYGKIVQRMEIAPAEEQPIHIDATALVLPGLSLAFGEVSSMTGERTNAMRADGTSDIFISFAEAGMAVNDGHKGETIVSPGSAVVTSLDRPVSFFMPERRNRLLSLQVSRHALAPYISGVDDYLTAAVDLRQPSAQILLTYATSVIDTMLADPAASVLLRGPVAQHLLELTAVMLSDTSHVLDQTAKGGLRAARLAAVKAEIMKRIHQPRPISADDVAAQLDLTPRYVHMLFHDEPYSFAEFVIEQRLIRAQTALADPLQAHRRIGDIAAEAGFGAIRTFNRIFMSRFGMTPSEARAQSKRTP